MENSNQIQPLEPAALLEFSCTDVICIPKSRYDELIRAEMEREILFHSYQLMGTSNMELVMDAIFNPKFKYKAGIGDAE